MKKKDPSNPTNDQSGQKQNEPEGYPLYPPKDDIYSRFDKKDNIDPDDPSQLKEEDPTGENKDELFDVDEEIMHTTLDIPGAELDDDLEEVGSEDEENNYYSLGGDNHHDLEEDDGEV